MQAAGPPGATPAVFISYASQDTAVANKVVGALEHSNVRCWIAPRDVTPGAFYADEIVHAIDAARALVLILSQNAAASQHVLREVERASAKRHLVVSLKIDHAPLPAGLEYFLNTSQWLDASHGDITDSLPKLINSVRIAVQAPAMAPQSVAPSLSAASPKRATIYIASLIVLGVGAYATYRLWGSAGRGVPARVPVVTLSASAPVPATATIPEKSVAVLPFVDMSEKKDQTYFGDGIAEEMTDILARIPQLKVIGRTSSFRFRDHAQDLHAVGAQLGVTYIVEGSVRSAGSRIRVTAQLFDTRSGTQLWADSYDRALGDVLALQGQLASSIARALQLVVAGDDTQPLRQLKSPEAYTLYLRGRAAYDRGEDGLSEAQADFEQVLVLEPTYSQAAEALALTHLGLIGDSVVSGRMGWPRAVNAATLALKLNPKSAFAHVILGMKLATYDYDWAGATKELEAALAAKSRDPIVLYNSSWLAFDVGRYEEAVHLEDASLSLDPLNPDSLQNGAIIHYLLGHLDLAERGLRKGLEVSPTFAGSHDYLGRILLLRGQPKGALKEMEAEVTSSRDVGLALAYQALGRRAESAAALARVTHSGGGLYSTDIATVHAYRGELTLAFDWFNRAIAAREIKLVHTLPLDPLLASLRADPRYSTLLRKMNLPQATRSGVP